MKRIMPLIITGLLVAVFCILISQCTLFDNHTLEKNALTNEFEGFSNYNGTDYNAVVCVDAGHGFGDIGCESKYLKGVEAEVTLEMANLLKKELENRNIRVILTHNGKKFPSCKEIIKTADKYEIEYDNTRLVENEIYSAYERSIYAICVDKIVPIDLFVSLHVNSIENNEQLSQYELYYYEGNPNIIKLNKLCRKLADSFGNYTKITPTNAQDSYTVTRYCTFPSLLIEMGYATNKNDAKNLNSSKWREKFAKNTAKTIDNWINDFKEE